MAKAGQVDGITTKDKDFSGSGVEGQKATDQSTGTGEPPAADPPDQSSGTEEPPAADPPDQSTGTGEPSEADLFDDIEDVVIPDKFTSVVTMRDGGPKRVWFRDGKEVGVEDVG